MKIPQVKLPQVDLSKAKATAIDAAKKAKTLAVENKNSIIAGSVGLAAGATAVKVAENKANKLDYSI